MNYECTLYKFNNVYYVANNFSYDSVSVENNRNRLHFTTKKFKKKKKILNRKVNRCLKKNGAQKND